MNRLLFNKRKIQKEKKIMTIEEIEYLHALGKMPDWAYYQTNGRSPQYNYWEQKKKINEKLKKRLKEKKQQELSKKKQEQLMEKEIRKILEKEIPKQLDKNFSKR